MLLLFSGQIAPLSLLPHSLQVASKILPLYWTVGFPTELLLGKLTLSTVLTGIGIQIVWLIIALFLVRIIWRLGTRAYSAVGQ
jgi:ABC-2 type transport system permease protein